MVSVAFTMKYENTMLGYTFSTSTTQELKIKLSEYTKQLQDSGILGYATHTLQTSQNETIVEYDEYFKSTEFFDSIDGFIEAINLERQLTSLDIASYLDSKYTLSRFQLQKILYYIYSDYLCENKTQLFKAKFEAWNYGPVDSNIYRIKKYDPATLKKQTIYNKLDSTTTKILDFLDDKCTLYKDRLNDIENNPTHRENTPWSLTFSDGSGKNNVISDKLILESHLFEKI